jgi:hypothetical protein
VPTGCVRAGHTLTSVLFGQGALQDRARALALTNLSRTVGVRTAVAQIRFAYSQRNAAAPATGGVCRCASCLMNFGGVREKLGSRYDSLLHLSSALAGPGGGLCWSSSPVPDQVGGLVAGGSLLLLTAA